MRTPAKEWAERVRAWRESGQTAAVFAAEKGFTERTLRWWSGEFERRSRRSTPSIPMARVVRTTPESTPVVVTVGAVRLEVRAGFDRALLREIVDALGGTR